MSAPEEMFFWGGGTLADVVSTGGTIPSDLGDLNKIREVLDDMGDFEGKKHIFHLHCFKKIIIIKDD
jgi:hypothetical protein